MFIIYTLISLRFPQHWRLASLRRHGILPHLASDPISLVVTPNHSPHHLSPFLLLAADKIIRQADIIENSEVWCGPEGFPEYFSLGRKQRGSLLWSEVGPTRTKRIAVFLWSWPWRNQYLKILCPFYTLMFLTCYITFICEFSRVTCLQKIQRKEIYSYFNESLRRAAFSTYKGSSKGTERGCIYSQGCWGLCTWKDHS